MRPATDDPSALSPHERLRELTAILANGIHRFLKRFRNHIQHDRMPAMGR